MPNSSLFEARQTIVFEGDSLTHRRMPPALDTWPFLRMMNWQGTWADVFSEWLFANRPDLRLTFRNAAVGGSHVRDMQGRLESMVVPLKPDWMLLTAGNNDPKRGISLDEFGEGINAYFDRLQAACGTRIIAIGGFEPAPGLRDPNHFEARRPYHRLLREAVERHDGRYLDIGKPLQQAALLHYEHSDYHTIYSDGGHFNALGAQMLAMIVLRELGLISY